MRKFRSGEISHTQTIIGVSRLEELLRGACASLLSPRTEVKDASLVTHPCTAAPETPPAAGEKTPVECR